MSLQNNTSTKEVKPSTVKVKTDAGIKSKMNYLQKFQLDSSIPYWSLEKIYQKLAEKYLDEFIEETMEAAKIIKP